MNYYNEIKSKLIDNEIYAKVNNLTQRQLQERSISRKYKMF